LIARNQMGEGSTALTRRLFTRVEAAKSFIRHPARFRIRSATAISPLWRHRAHGESPTLWGLLRCLAGVQQARMSHHNVFSVAHAMRL